MSRETPSVIRIVLPQIAGYLAAAVGFALPILVFVFVILPLLDHWNIEIRPQHQKYGIVALLFAASITAIVSGGLCGTYVNKRLHGKGHPTEDSGETSCPDPRSE